MNKKVLKILFIIFIMNINIISVSALDCNDISKEVDKYYSYKDELAQLDCTDVSNEEVVNSCNDINMGKNLIVQNLMRLSDEEKVCSSVKPQVNEILKENEKNCGRIFDDSFYKFINTVMRLFYIIGPILLIVFGTLDYTKVIISSDKEALKKANKKFFKRLIATFILFLTPLLTNFILSINSSGISLSGNAYTCKYTHINYKKQFQIIKIKSKSKSSSGSSANNTQSGYPIFKQSDSQWGSDLLLCSNSTTIAKAGCALSSVAMQIVNSGVETTETINPGTLNKIMKNSGSCSGANIIWNNTTYATNNKFTQNTQYYYLTGNISDKANQLSDYISQGFYPVIQVKCEPGITGCSHYVAVFYVDNGNIYVGDPAKGEVINLNESGYKIASETYNSQLILYEKSN